MSHETSAFDEIANGIASYAGEAGGDIQRYIVAPAMLDMVGPVHGQQVLDLFCGAGYLSRRLSALGASVTAVDNSERLIGIAGEIKNREHHDINYAVAEPTDLSVIEDSSFDDIVCNMGLMLSRDLAGTVAELARLVKLGGRFIFSVLHPCFCMPDACWVKDEDGKMLYKTVDDYFIEGWWPSELAASIRSGQKKIKHRTLSRYINALGARGFTVRRIIEPRPSPDVITLKPHLDIYNRLPAVVVIEAVFPFI
ncbi:MAG: class I SAM-dependent methyltransferase [Armatimonadetes bacterium]|nr:class I SAM-dependent methyltransferase [Armatimonadota bacterium]